MRTLNKWIIAILIFISLTELIIITNQSAKIEKYKQAIRQYHEVVEYKMERLDILEYKIRSMVDIWE